MNTLFITIFLMSVTGTLLMLCLSFLRPVTRKHFSAAWHYRAFIVVLLFLLVPVGVVGGGLLANIPNETSGELPNVPVILNDIITVSQSNIDPAQSNTIPVLLPPQEITPPTNDVDSTTPEIAAVPVFTLQTFLSYIPFVWLLGVFSFMSWHIIHLVRFKRKLIRTSLELENAAILSAVKNAMDNMEITSNIHAFSNNIVKTPMLVGLFKTRLILPEVEMNERELSFILKHELIHFKRRDLWVKSLALVANAIHWFNPVAYRLTKQIDTFCELSCDERVVMDMNTEERQFYGETILNVLCRVVNQFSGVHATLANQKKGIEKRLTHMMTVRKKSKHIILISLITALLLCSAGCAAASLLSINGNVPVVPLKNASKMEEPVETLVEPTVSSTPAPTLEAPTFITIMGEQYDTNLTELRIDGDIEVRSTLTSEDLEPLKHMTHLQQLWIRWFDLSDISMLANLTNLTDLNLYGCKVVDISPLQSLSNLEALCLTDNQIEDISAVSSLTKLWSLSLDGNRITDISPLEGLTAITSLSLSGNPIVDGDISVLASLVNLGGLSLSKNQIRDISSLEALVHIRVLDLQGNQIADINPLRNMASLQDLRISGNQINDISILKELRQLSQVAVVDNPISDEHLSEIKAALPNCTFWNGYWDDPNAPKPDPESKSEGRATKQEMLDFYNGVDTIIDAEASLGGSFFGLHSSDPGADMQFFGIQLMVYDDNTLERYELRENYTDGTLELISLVPEVNPNFAKFVVIDSKPLSKDANWETMQEIFNMRRPR